MGRALGIVYHAQPLGIFDAGDHDGEWFVAPALASPQLAHGMLARRIAGKVKAAKPLDGHDATCSEHRRAPLDDGVACLARRANLRRGVVCRALAPGDMGATGKAGIGLRVEAAVGGIGIFGGAGGTHGERAHRRVCAIVGKRIDDGEARPAVGAVDEGIVVAAVAGVEELAQAVGAGGDIRRDERGARAMAL